MRFTSRSLRPRTVRAFSISSFECETRLEARSLAVPLLTAPTGFVTSRAQQAQGGAVTFTDNTLALTTLTDVAVTGDETIDLAPAQGSGSFTGSDTATSTVTTATGQNGGSSITIAVLQTAQYTGSVSAGSTGVIPAPTVSSQTYSSTAPGTVVQPGALAPPLTWAVGDSNPKETAGTVTYTFTISGSSGVNSSTNATVAGGDQLWITTPNFNINMNTNGFNGLWITRMNPATAMQQVLYENDNPDGSPDGVILYAPGDREATGSFSYSATFQMSFPIATKDAAPFAIAYNSGLGEGVQPGLQAGQQVAAMPSLKWTLDVSTS